jgi:tRNA nucleotidyltransferase (CCA-adding enzyme)
MDRTFTAEDLRSVQEDPSMEIVATHKGTDFDALASVVAAQLLYPESVGVLPQSLNPNVRSFISLHKNLFDFSRTTEIDFDGVTRLIVVDTNQWERLDGLQPLEEKKGLTIHLFDHHGGKGDLQPTWECRDTVGANITLMLRQLGNRQVELTPIHASLFLAGLYEDTGNLTFSSTTPEDAQAAAFLLERGADLKILNAFVTPVYSRKQKDLLFEMLQTANRIKLNDWTVSINQLRVEDHVENLGYLVQMVRQVLNVDAAFGLFLQEKNRCLVIGRSITEAINVGAIMRCMGGGGHCGAGSTMIRDANPAVLLAWIRILISGESRTSEQVQDLMTAPVFVLTPETTMASALQALRNRGIHGAPIVDEGRLLGMISMRDRKRLKKPEQYRHPVKAFMSQPVYTISPAKSPAEAAHLMVKHDIGRLPVLDGGKLVGIITRSDAMGHFYGLCPIDGHIDPALIATD